MPQIREYTNQVNGLQPTDQGVQAVAGAARRIGSNYASAADATSSVGNRFASNLGSAIRDAGDVAVKFVEHREISHGAASYATLNENLTKAWNDRAKTADPNDPTVAAKFREEALEPALEKYRQAFVSEGGQKYADARVDSLRNHFVQKTSADMGTLAANAVAVNVRQMGNSMSNTAMNDPSAVPHLLEGLDSSVGAMVDSSPNVTGVVAAKAKAQLSESMREGIVKAGAIGAIQKSGDPEATAKAWGEKYPQYISGADLKTLSANARQQLRADRQDRAYVEHLSKVAAQDQSDKAVIEYRARLESDDLNVKSQVKSKDIVNDWRLTRRDKEHMLGVLDREVKPETDARISNRGYMEVLSDIRSGKISDTGPIYDARINGKLNRGDFNQALKDFTEYRSPNGEPLAKDRTEFFKRFAPTIDPSMGDVQSMQFGHHSALGLTKMYEAEKAARRMEEDLRKAGKDPHLLYDPASPEFFGRPANIIKYRASLQDSQKYQKELGIKPAGTVTGVEVIEIPRGMTPAEAMKNYKSGTRIRLNDGRTGTVP